MTTVTTRDPNNVRWVTPAKTQVQHNLFDLNNTSLDTTAMDTQPYTQPLAATPLAQESAPEPTPKNVAPEAQPTADPRGRVAYSTMEGVALNEAGQYTEGLRHFDKALHLKPKKTDFSDGALYLDFCADVAAERVVHFTKARDSYAEQAASFRQYGDDRTRKLIAKRDRMADQLAELEASIKAEELAAATAVALATAQTAVTGEVAG